MRHAIAINKERRPLYAALTQGRSLPISNKLIFLETIARISSHTLTNFDEAARVYQEKGVNIVCDEFIDMAFTPPFRPRFEDGAPRLSDYKDIQSSDLNRVLRTAFRQEGFRGLHREATNVLSTLAREPRLNCMLRHTLESMARIAALSPTQECRARSVGLPSTEALSKKMIRVHFLLLGDVIEIDRRTAPLNSEGVPFVCGDVPGVPVPDYPADCGR